MSYCNDMLEQQDIANQLHSLAEAKNWKQVLQLSKTLPLEEKRKILWIWPTEFDLCQLQAVLRKLGIANILSIGCGSGLFEWILQESIYISVFGLEIDQSWWTSSYSVKSFIPLSFVDVSTVINSELLQNCCQKQNWEFALLFCYFNNRDAFYRYLSCYKGNWVIIIGPSAHMNIHTDPHPSELQFQVDKRVWTLFTSLEISNSYMIAFYTI